MTEVKGKEGGGQRSNHTDTQKDKNEKESEKSADPE